MYERRFQYRLWSLHVAVACVALILGAAQGGIARVILLVVSAAYVAVMSLCLLCVMVIFLLYGAAAAGCWTMRLAHAPGLARQVLFERRLSRIRPGNTSQFVRKLLGSPSRVDGFGDRLYWSYRVAGHRYTVSFDPRRLVAKYSNGLARDVPARSC